MIIDIRYVFLVLSLSFRPIPVLMHSIHSLQFSHLMHFQTYCIVFRLVTRCFETCAFEVPLCSPPVRQKSLAHPPPSPPPPPRLPSRQSPALTPATTALAVTRSDTKEDARRKQNRCRATWCRAARRLAHACRATWQASMPAPPPAWMKCN